MKVSEHLIEAALSFYEEQDELGVENIYEVFVENKVLKALAEQVGIKLTDLWFITQYIECTYKKDFIDRITELEEQIEYLEHENRVFIREFELAYNDLKELKDIKRSEYSTKARNEIDSEDK